MRRILVALILTLSTMAACSPTPAEAGPATTTTTTTPVACDRACWEQIKQRQQNERIYWAAVVEQQKERARIHRLFAFAAAVEAQRVAAERNQRIACDGAYPPCWRIYGTGTGGRGESGGDPRIWNGGCYAPVGWAGGPPCPKGTSTASGGFQITRGTWGRFGGYLNAADAPVRVQNEKARQLWNGGRGCSHWSACRRQ